jgi:putative transposase
MRRGFGRLKVLFADSAYARCGLPEWVRAAMGWILQNMSRPVGLSGFVVLPKRWFVEHTFAWLSRCRHHSKDYERTCQSSQAMMIHITALNLMSRRRVRLKS